MASERRGKPWKESALEDPTDFLGRLQEMAYTMREQAVATHQMMD